MRYIYYVPIGIFKNHVNFKHYKIKTQKRKALCKK